MKLATACVLAGLSGVSFAKSSQTVFAPKNDWYKYDNVNSKDASMTEAKFNEIVDYVGSFYKDLASGHGANLTFEKKWTDPTVNAYANQSGNTWTVSMFGGLARRPEVTNDGFALVVCHELGHHFGGFPFYDATDWAASEGQSDYFATQVCGKRIWRNQPEENAKFRATAPAVVKEACNAHNATTADQDLCYRLAMGGKSLADLLAALGGEGAVNFNTPDANVVTTTAVEHPKGQCRLDTYFRGALCSNSSWADTVIPSRNHPDGQTSVAAEMVASAYSCTEAGNAAFGARPRCWFAPKLAASIARNAASVNQIDGNGNGAWEPGEVFGFNVPVTNNLLAPLTDAKLTVTSASSGVTIENATVDYPAIPVGATLAAEEAVAVSIDAEATCGSRFTLTAKAQSSNWSASQDFEYLLGKFAQAGKMSASPARSIPDNSQTGITESLTFTTGKMAQRAVVAVDVTHTYPGDVKITLTSPSGKSYVVFNRVQNTTGAIKQTFNLDIAPETTDGAWKLLVQDLASYDEGKLNSWSLELQSLSCDATLTFLGNK